MSTSSSNHGATEAPLQAITSNTPLTPTQDLLPPSPHSLALVASKLPEPDLISMLDTLVITLNPSTLTHMVHFGQQKLRRDFIKLLPVELSLLIFAYLSVFDHCNALRVSKHWHRVGSAPSLWRHRFKFRNWTLHNKMSFVSNLEYLVTNHANLNTIIDSVLANNIPDNDTLPWQYLFQQRHTLDSNIKSGKYSRREFIGHTEGVYCIQADDRKLMSGSRDDTVRIWDLSTGRSTHTLTGHTGSVLCLEYNQTHLVTGSSDRSIRIWGIPADPLDPMQVYTNVAELNGHVEAVLNLRMDSIRNRIVSCSKDYTIRLWDAGTGKCLGQLSGHQAAVNAVQIFDDMLVSASGDKKLRIWDLRLPPTQAEIGKLEGHTRGIACVAFDGQYVCSGSSDQSIRVWDLRNMSGSKPLVQVITGHDDLVRTLQFSAADNILVSGSYDESVRVWHLHSGKQIHALQTGARVFNVQWQAGMVFTALQMEKLLEFNFRSQVDMLGILPPSRW